MNIFPLTDTKTSMIICVLITLGNLNSSPNLDHIWQFDTWPAAAEFPVQCL